MMFVGDSLNRDQFTSLVCLLHSVLPNNSKSMEINGSFQIFRTLVSTYWPKINSSISLPNCTTSSLTSYYFINKDYNARVLLGSFPPRIKLWRRCHPPDGWQNRPARIHRQARPQLEGRWRPHLQYLSLVDDRLDHEDDVRRLLTFYFLPIFNN